MKSPILSTIAALIIICLSISYSSGEVTDESEFREKKEVEDRPSAATVGDVRNGEDAQKPDIIGGDGELFHGFTQEEIEKNRIITIDWDGIETVSTDEEVIQTLKRARQGNSTFLRDEPHFILDKRRSVIGCDERYRRYNTQSDPPYSAIGYLAPDGCTAYLVGPRHLITAAHCVHNGTDTQDIYHPSELTFYLRRNCYGNRHGIIYNISNVTVYSRYRNFSDSDYDIAFLDLSSSASDWMGFAYKDPMPTVSGEICGYPGDKAHPTCAPSDCFFCSRCNDVRRMRTGWWGRNSNRLEYTCDTAGGMSGSPVMTDDHDSSSELYSYGVHTNGVGIGSRNKGVRITRNRFIYICRWKCNTGSHCSILC